MKKLLLLGLILLVSCSSGVQPQSVEIEPLKQSTFEKDMQGLHEPIDEAVIDDITDFTSRIVANLFEPENSVASPLSYYIALSMTIDMAQGDTQQQLIDFLGESRLDKDFFTILEFNNEIGTMTFANSMWLAQGRDFNQNLIETISTDYRASIYEVDFTDKENAEKLMNDWVNKMTNNFIKDVSVKVTPNMIMSFFNTIYLKDSWQIPFDKSLSYKDDFKLLDGTTVEADFMHEKETEAIYVDGSNFQMTSKTLSNYSRVNLVLPDKDLSEIMTEATMKEIFAAIKEPTEGYVTLNLPRFDLSSSYDLIPVSKEMGLTLPFDASTSQIYPFASDESVYISVIQQQARLKVNEEGLEAAVYTQVGFDASATMGPHVQLTYDRPFLVIVTSPQGVPTFVGTVYDPTK